MNDRHKAPTYNPTNRNPRIRERGEVWGQPFRNLVDRGPQHPVGFKP